MDIYLLLEETTAEVICPSRPAAKLQVTGNGILQIATGCSLRTSEMTAITKLATSSIGGHLRAIPPPELDRMITGFTSE